MASINVKLNKQIYRLGAIKQAIKAYRDLAQFSLRQDPQYYKVTIDNIDFDFKDILRDEFANYILAVTKDAH
ncbi:MAG: hypothetical protein ISS45_04895 [Candidatus Omnitrophica bacterium]|nr:hypothetical protein [Candidatus Omnitrophota bacterium]